MPGKGEWKLLILVPFIISRACSWLPFLPALLPISSQPLAGRSVYPMCSILCLFLLNFTTFLFCHFFILLRSLWMATHWWHALVWCCPLTWWGCIQSPLVLNFIKNKMWNVKLLDKNSLRKTIISISFMLKKIIFGCPLCMLCDLYNFPWWKEKNKKR